MDMDLGAMLAALIAAATGIVSSIIAGNANKSVKKLENQFLKENESNTFREKQLSDLYFPMHVHLTITQALFKRFFEKNTSESEKENIEHTWKHHNSEMFNILTKNSGYLDVDAPNEVTQDLVEHILQWNIVYNMKYVDKKHTGPVFSGTSQFGFRGFPKGKSVYSNSETGSEGVDGYFKDKTESLRILLHSKILME